MAQGSQIVNRLGRYFKKHLTGSGTINNESNVCTVSIPLSYTVKPDKDTLDDGVNKDTPDEIGTITVQVRITTYNNAIVVSIINGDLYIDQKKYSIASFDDYEKQCEKILNNTKKRISKKYQQYDFQFDSL